MTTQVQTNNTSAAQVHVIACASVQDQHQVHVRVVSLVSPDCVITTTGDNQRIVCGRHLMCVEDTRCVWRTRDVCGGHQLCMEDIEEETQMRQ